MTLAINKQIDKGISEEEQLKNKVRERENKKETRKWAAKKMNE